MCDHGHSHGHGHGGHSNHGDDVVENFQGGYSLYQKIDLVNLECLNEAVDGSGAKVFKPWTERFNADLFVESDCDAELIFNIPFTGDVKLKGIVVIADESLAKLKMFKSKMRMSFDDVTAEADQEFYITHDPQGTIEYPVKPTKFFNMHHLTLHFVNRNKDDDNFPCKIYYIGLKGEFTPSNRDGIVIANYEIRPTEGIPEEMRKNTQEIQ